MFVKLPDIVMLTRLYFRAHASFNLWTQLSNYRSQQQQRQTQQQQQPWLMIPSSSQQANLSLFLQQFAYATINPFDIRTVNAK